MKNQKESGSTCHQLNGKNITSTHVTQTKMKLIKLTNKEAYEIVRDNTNWMWVFKQDVKFKYEWIFHRTRDCNTMEYHKGKEPIECYHISSLYSYEHTGYPIEPWSGCEVDKSPFKPKNDEATVKTVIELNRSYQKHKDDRFIEQVYEIAFTKEDSYFNEINKKYTRDDVLDRLMEMSNNSLELEEN